MCFCTASFKGLCKRGSAQLLVRNWSAILEDEQGGGKEEQGSRRKGRRRRRQGGRRRCGAGIQVQAGRTASQERPVWGG